jgi:hypothetical protein
MTRKRKTHVAAADWSSLMMLGMECQQAIALRLLRLSTGGAKARRESSLMVTEKMNAGVNAAYQIASGHSPASIVKAYRKKVRANIKRLSK